MTEGVLLQILITAVINGVAVLVVNGLKKSAQRQDAALAALSRKVDEVAHDVRDLAAKVGSHDASLAAGNQRFNDIERSVRDLQMVSRELEKLFRDFERSCLTRCRYPQVPQTPGA